jgi:hypothetical protein
MLAVKDIERGIKDEIRTKITDANKQREVCHSIWVLVSLV